jgi:hypothetical protein
MTWSRWLFHFEENAARPLPFLPETIEDVPAPLRAPLAVCLARFQLGESGGRRIIGQIDDEPLEGSSAEHRAALRLFLAEETRHARILSRLVLGLGGRLHRHGWARNAFRIGRNLFGLPEKLLVLNVAEVVGICCYGLLAEALPIGPTRAALAQIADDETHHLAFHSELFARQTRHVGWTRLLWWAVGLAACVSVIVDHGRVLRALGISSRRLGRVLLERLRDGAARMRPVAETALLQGRT